MEIREGLTFDDVLLEPGPSETMPAEADVSTRLTRDLEDRSRLWSRRTPASREFIRWLIRTVPSPRACASQRWQNARSICSTTFGTTI